ncbi:hypothetical protein GCM10023149_29820 [Mucilaginibacter gynuensis]|uniref:2'-5' RNA ligase superfamily protein n=2 Tax=Mucilaginibacter gynuensis TaxID=1302236 RepID=A0ABP8GLW7_9SPHI
MEQFEMTVSSLRHLGAGVAYAIESAELHQLHRFCSLYFAADLIPQDRQRFRPHITIENKVSPEASRHLLTILNNTFAPFIVQAIGLDLWEYLGGPWQHRFGHNFKVCHDKLDMS